MRRAWGVFLIGGVGLVGIALVWALIQFGGTSANSGLAEGLPFLPDRDGDGCNDVEELGSLPSIGGLRDPDNRWDFFDTPMYDGVVAVSDIGRVVSAFGTILGSANYNLLLDRGAPVPPYPWNLTEPDGAVSTGDIVGAVKQFGHHCKGGMLVPPAAPPLSAPLPDLIQDATGLTDYGEMASWMIELLGPINQQLYPQGENGPKMADGYTLQPDPAARGSLGGSALPDGTLVCISPDGSISLLLAPITLEGQIDGVDQNTEETENAATC